MEQKFAMDFSPSAKVVHLHRQKVYKGAQVIAILLVICGILAMVIPGKAALIGWVTGSLTLLAAVVGLLPLYFKARNLDRALTFRPVQPVGPLAIHAGAVEAVGRCSEGTHEGEAFQIEA